MIYGGRLSGKSYFCVCAFDLIRRKNVDLEAIKESPNFLVYNTKISMSVLKGEREELNNNEFLMMKGLLIL